jgi:hypothetical protein
MFRYSVPTYEKIWCICHKDQSPNDIKEMIAVHSDNQIKLVKSICGQKFQVNSELSLTDNNMMAYLVMHSMLISGRKQHIKFQRNLGSYEDLNL